jgi:hypothetical protein
LESLHSFSHVVKFDNFIKILLILFSIINGQSYSISTESTSSSDSMQVCIWIWAFIYGWYIEVDD